MKTETVYTMLVMINSYYVNQQQQWLEKLANACAHACDLKQADRQGSQSSCTGHRLSVNNNIGHGSNQALHQL